MSERKRGQKWALQLCVSRAMFQGDRIECLKAKP